MGPFLVKQAFPNGSIEINDPKDGKIFKVNGHCLKHYVEKVDEPEEITLVAPIYLNWCLVVPPLYHTFIVFKFLLFPFVFYYAFFECYRL